MNPEKLLRWKPVIEESEIIAEEKELSEEGWQILIDASAYPSDGISERFKRQKLSACNGERAVKEIVNRNLIKTWIVSGRHGKKVLIEILDAGWNLLKKIGKEKPKSLTKGGFLHNLSVGHLADWAKSEGYQYWTNFCRGDKEVDFVFQDSEGRLIAVEVQMTNSHVKENIIKDIEQAKMDFIVVACNDRSVSDGAKEIVSSLDEHLRQKVKVCLLSDVNKMEITQLVNKGVR